MRFRTGVVVGFGVGYYYGAKAGRARFEQIDRVLRRVGAAESLDVAGEKARAAVDLGLERARDLLGMDVVEPTPAPVPEAHRGLPTQPPADPSLN